nr:DUF120 domain-containing protein [Bacteroidota bacterium]
MYKFTGQVYLGSSVGNAGPPGETEISKHNPQRIIKLIELCSFDSLEPGTLNLNVDESVVKFLKNLNPDWLEPPNEINPPNDHYDIHYKRGGYKYFSGVIIKDIYSIKIIARIGAVNPLPNTVEIYSNQKVRNKLALNDGDKIDVYILGVAV